MGRVVFLNQMSTVICEVVIIQGRFLFTGPCKVNNEELILDAFSKIINKI